MLFLSFVISLAQSFLCFNVICYLLCFVTCMGQLAPLWHSWGSSSLHKQRSLVGRTELSDQHHSLGKSQSCAPAPTSNSDLWRGKKKKKKSVHSNEVQLDFNIIIWAAEGTRHNMHCYFSSFLQAFRLWLSLVVQFTAAFRLWVQRSKVFTLHFIYKGI